MAIFPDFWKIKRYLMKKISLMEIDLSSMNSPYFYMKNITVAI